MSQKVHQRIDFYLRITHHFCQPVRRENTSHTFKAAIYRRLNPDRNISTIIYITISHFCLIRKYYIRILHAKSHRPLACHVQITRK